ncbi:DUF6161 domain-containing protein [Arenimonas donghaensis]|uniref:DUF6161 domain-containing protein n=1 Tax=Arenimonas donghaensis TaxID=375061 RepID=UPI0012679BB8|nr:DUF6161 domain-containing protein [Arenimonas donghaensis]
MTENPAFHLNVEVGLQEPITFDTPGKFSHWIQSEASHWKPFSEGGGYHESDVVGDLGQRGSAEHAAEWSNYAERAEQAASASDAVRETLIFSLATEVSERILAHEIIYSRSQLGFRIISLFEVDEAAARVLVAISTGRDISRVIHPSNLRRLWRSIPRTLLAGSEESLRTHAAQGVRDIELSVAGARDKEEGLGRTLRQAKEATAAMAEDAEVLLRERLEVLKSEADEFLGSVQEEWTDLRATYDTQLALRAPRNYWNDRRRSHRVGASIWGALAAIFALFIAFRLVPHASEMLIAKSATIVISGATKLDLGVIPFLPELFQIAVVGFLCLWALRFSVRQAAEHLGRLQEASIRVTMVETFLALSNPNQENRALVDEADRAVIVQALFRPGLGEGIDDAPPVHWIEDVFRRLRKPSDR